MFDIGFSEFVLIALLALIVLGPKRLPEVARTAGQWAGRIRRFVDSVKRDMDREMQDEGLAAIRDAHRTIKEAQSEISRSASEAVYDIIEAPSPDADPAPPRDIVESLPGEAPVATERKEPPIAMTAQVPHDPKPGL